MQEKIAVYSALFGTKDTFRPPLVWDSNNCDYFLFGETAPKYNITPYRFIKRPAELKDNAKNARKLKILGDPLLLTYKTIIWHDANMQINENAIIDLCSTHSLLPLYCFKHPVKNDPYSEAMACIRVKKGNARLLLKQIWSYFLKGLPAHSGLYSTGLLVKNDPIKNKKFYESWWAQVLKYSRRDQIALAFVNDKTPLEIGEIEGNIFDNRYFTYFRHNYLEYRSIDGTLKNNSNWVSYMCFYMVKLIRKLSKLKG